MYEFGEQAQRNRLRRLHPDASYEEIEMAIRAWRVSRPGAPMGDAMGRPSRRFG
jgi:Rv0078B-related antitoxin